MNKQTVSVCRYAYRLREENTYQKTSKTQPHGALLVPKAKKLFCLVRLAASKIIIKPLFDGGREFNGDKSKMEVETHNPTNDIKSTVYGVFNVPFERVQDIR